MTARRITVDELSTALPPGGLTMVSGCSAESPVIAEAVKRAGDALGAMRFCGIVVPGLNRETYLHGSETRFTTFFQTPELRAAGERTQFLPLCYNDALDWLRRERPAAALTMLSPPDTEGFCSFGAQTDFTADLWSQIPVKIAHINPSMPRTNGWRGPHIDELTAVIEADTPLLETYDPEPDAISIAIGEEVARFIGDGATLQTGVGKIPGAVLRALTARRGLKTHSGLLGDAALDLIDAGSMAPGASATVGVAIGSRRLYDRIGEASFNFQPVSVTHDPWRISAEPHFVAVNSALQVDLFGQVFAELTPKGLMSGPGGASDFARGGKIGEGRRIVALPSTAGKNGAFSRIVPPGEGLGPVSLGRMDVDVVVTEHGAAVLSGEGYESRARRLIEIAHPEHRKTLAEAWGRFSGAL